MLFFVRDQQRSLRVCCGYARCNIATQPSPLALDAWMLVPGWVKGQSNPQNTDVGLRHVADHLEYLCNLAGNTRHAALGTDLDGGFGKEQGPADLDTIAGLQQLVPMLTERGFTRDDVANIFHGNAIRFLKEAWK